MDFLLFLFELAVITIHQLCYCQSLSGNTSKTTRFTSPPRPKPIWNATYVDKLRRDLLLNYDKFARPTHHNNATQVSVGLTILHIEMNEFKSTINVNSWLRMSWSDNKLKWNFSDYGRLSSINVASHEIWQPDVVLYNSASGSLTSHLSITECIVTDNGDVIWVPPIQLSSLCELNLRYWPFDVQNCTLKFGSWTYHGNEIDLKLFDEPIDLSMVMSGEWNVTSTNATRKVKIYECCEETYISVYFELILTRRSSTYRALIITPAIGDTADKFTKTPRPAPIWNATYVDKLKHDQLLNYNKFGRPLQQRNNLTTASIGIVILHLDMDEFKSTMHVNIWFRLTWFDERLQWNESDYGGLSQINFMNHEIWKPEIVLYNSATGRLRSSFNVSECLVYGNGDVLWVPPILLTSLCELNFRYWPFDTQNCTLKFGAWSYGGDEIDLKLYSTDPIDLSEMMTNGEWNVSSSNAMRKPRYHECGSDSYMDVFFELILTRRSPTYKALIITPAVAIIMLTLMGFWLPPQAEEKVILNGFTAIIITIFMAYFTQKIPAMGSHTPLIVLFYSTSLYIVCFSMVTSVVVIGMSRTQHNKHLPRVIKKHLIGTLGRFLCLGYYIEEMSHQTNEEMRDSYVPDCDEHQIADADDHQFIGSSIKFDIQQDWTLFAAAIDRISFLFYGFVFAVLACVYSL